MKNKYYESAAHKLFVDYQIDILKDVLLGVKDRILLYADISKKENIEFHVISGSLELIGLADSESIFLSSILERINLNNKYSDVSGKMEYKDYIYSSVYRFSQEVSFSLPVIINHEKKWMNIEINSIEKHPNILIYSITDVTQMMMVEELNFEKTHRDSLTGLFNRYTFDFHYGERYQRENLHVIYLDIDNFKTINDTYGHAKGNEYLIAFAQTLMTFQTEYNLFYRLGGDEFVGLFFEKEEKVKEIAEEIIQLTSQITLDGASSTTVSVGIIQAIKREDLARKADDLMYEVKKSGKNRYIYRREI